MYSERPDDSQESLPDLLRRLADSVLRDPWKWLGGALAIGGAAAGAIEYRRNRLKRIFISFAIEDSFYREALRGQSLNARTPFEFRDMGLDDPFSERWKTQCREVIKTCDGVIALISTNTASADGARWEMKCAAEESVPILGVHVRKDAKGAVPPELRGQRVIEWSWDGIARFIDSL